MRVWADNLMIWAKDEPAMKTIADDFVVESPGKNFAEMAYSVRDFSLILNRYGNLRQIIFATHGKPGYVYLEGGGATISDIDVFEPPHDRLFSSEGRVLFYGCNIAEGAAGLAFLEAVGRTIFRGKGGIVGASDSKNIFGRWGLFDARIPGWDPSN